MATTNKIEKIFAQDNDVVKELTGAEKEAFLAQREADNLEEEKRKAEMKTQRELKVSAYTKLGLTAEEINAIL